MIYIYACLSGRNVEKEKGETRIAPHGSALNRYRWPVKEIPRPLRGWTSVILPVCNITSIAITVQAFSHICAWILLFSPDLSPLQYFPAQIKHSVTQKKKKKQKVREKNWTFSTSLSEFIRTLSFAKNSSCLCHLNLSANFEISLCLALLFFFVFFCLLLNALELLGWTRLCLSFFRFSR